MAVIYLLLARLNDAAQRHSCVLTTSYPPYCPLRNGFLIWSLTQPISPMGRMSIMENEEGTNDASLDDSA